MENAEKQRLHVYIHGRVQGVGFRHFTMRTAGELGVSGWVRNLRDGRVEIAAEGKTGRLEKLLRAVKRGPASANVREVEEEWGKEQGEFHGFTVRRTI
jgi:acylphosphatase